jgi:hypothetical protein
MWSMDGAQNEAHTSTSAIEIALPSATSIFVHCSYSQLTFPTVLLGADSAGAVSVSTLVRILLRLLRLESPPTGVIDSLSSSPRLIHPLPVVSPHAIDHDFELLLTMSYSSTISDYATENFAKSNDPRAGTSTLLRSLPAASSVAYPSPRLTMPYTSTQTSPLTPPMK